MFGKTHNSASEILGLAAERRARPIEGDPVGADADDGHRARPVAPHLAFEAGPAGADLVGSQFRR